MWEKEGERASGVELVQRCLEIVEEEKRTIEMKIESKRRPSAFV